MLDGGSLTESLSSLNFGAGGREGAEKEGSRSGSDGAVPIASSIGVSPAQSDFGSSRGRLLTFFCTQLVAFRDVWKRLRGRSLTARRRRRPRPPRRIKF